MPRLDQPLPVGIVRDLLAIARMLYRSARSAGDAARVDELEQIGKQLTTALELAKAPPGSLGHRSAWSHAELALARLGASVGAEARVLELLAAAGDDFK
jgi:hypothetical protein